MNTQYILLAMTLIVGMIVARPVMAAEPKEIFTKLISPVGMQYDKEGALLVAEWGANRVSKITAQGKRSIVTDQISSPSGLALGDDGTLFIVSYADGGIYALDAQGRLKKLASGFSSPVGLVFAQDKTLLIANRNAGEIVKLSLNGERKVISKKHKTPVGIAQTTDGSIYVSCFSGGIDRISPTGEITTVHTKLNTPGAGIIADGTAIFVVDYGSTTITRINEAGNASIVAEGLLSPVGLARMPDGRLMVGTWGDNATHIVTVK